MTAEVNSHFCLRICWQYIVGRYGRKESSEREKKAKREKIKN
jgi:hypothetical protein